jgi:hypothetical protein
MRSDQMFPHSPPTAISPTQTAVTRNAFSTYVFYGYKRLLAQAPYFAIPFGLGECQSFLLSTYVPLFNVLIHVVQTTTGYGIITWGKSKNAWYNSKAGHLAVGEHEE